MVSSRPVCEATYPGHVRCIPTVSSCPCVLHWGYVLQFLIEIFFCSTLLKAMCAQLVLTSFSQSSPSRPPRGASSLWRKWTSRSFRTSRRCSASTRPTRFRCITAPALTSARPASGCSSSSASPSSSPHFAPSSASTRSFAIAGLSRHSSNLSILSSS